MPSRPGQARAERCEAVQIEPPLGIEAERGGLGAGSSRRCASAAACRPRRSRPAPGDSSQRSRCAARAIVGRVGDRCAQDEAARPAGVVASTSSSLVPTLPMCGKVKVIDLTGVGRIGQDLLIAGHGGVEDQLAHHLGGRAQALAMEHRAIRKHEAGGGRERTGKVMKTAARSLEARPVRPGDRLRRRRATGSASGRTLRHG